MVPSFLAPAVTTSSEQTGAAERQRLLNSLLNLTLIPPEPISLSDHQRHKVEAKYHSSLSEMVETISACYSKKKQKSHSRHSEPRASHTALRCRAAKGAPDPKGLLGGWFYISVPSKRKSKGIKMLCGLFSLAITERRKEESQWERGSKIHSLSCELRSV